MTDVAKRGTDGEGDRGEALPTQLGVISDRICEERASIWRRYTTATASVVLFIGVLIGLGGVVFRSSPSIRANEGVQWAVYVGTGLAVLALLIVLFGRFRFDCAVLACRRRGTLPDAGPALTGKVELFLFEDAASRRARNAGTSANHWWLLRIWVGGVAAILAALGGIGTIIQTKSSWRIVIAGLAILGSALVTVITGLNAGKEEEKARAQQIAFEALAIRARLWRGRVSENDEHVSRDDINLLYEDLYQIARQGTQGGPTTRPQHQEEAERSGDGGLS